MNIELPKGSTPPLHVRISVGTLRICTSSTSTSSTSNKVDFKNQPLKSSVFGRVSDFGSQNEQGSDIVVQANPFISTGISTSSSSVEKIEKQSKVPAASQDANNPFTAGVNRARSSTATNSNPFGAAAVGSLVTTHNPFQTSVAAEKVEKNPFQQGAYEDNTEGKKALNRKGLFSTLRNLKKPEQSLAFLQKRPADVSSLAKDDESTSQKSRRTGIRWCFLTKLC